MSDKLQNYQPARPHFVLDERIAEAFPLQLDFSAAGEGLDTKRGAMQYVSQQLAATFPEGEYVTRHMDDHEKAVLRADYCQLVENVLPERKRQYEEALEEAKRLKKEGEERYAAALQEIQALAAEVKQDIVETKLKGADTFCIALAGYYLYYTWCEAQRAFLLAKATPVTGGGDLFASDEKNRAVMLEVFGAEFPETVAGSTGQPYDLGQPTDDNPDF